MVQSQQDVGGVEPCSILLEATNLRQIEEQFATRAILEDEEELGVALEGVVHLDYKRVPHIFLKHVIL